MYTDVERSPRHFVKWKTYLWIYIALDYWGRRNWGDIKIDGAFTLYIPKLFEIFIMCINS